MKPIVLIHRAPKYTGTVLGLPVGITLVSSRYYFQFDTSKESRDKSKTVSADFVVTPKPLLPEISPQPIIPKKNRRIANKLIVSKSRLALEKAKLDVHSCRSLEYSRDDKLWSVVKSSSLSSLRSSKTIESVPSSAYSTNRLKEHSLKITQRTMKEPGPLLSGVRSTKDDLKYVIKTPKFNPHMV